jgi:hypothetical protein
MPSPPPVFRHFVVAPRTARAAFFLPFNVMTGAVARGSARNAWEACLAAEARRRSWTAAGTTADAPGLPGEKEHA